MKMKKTTITLVFLNLAFAATSLQAQPPFGGFEGGGPPMGGRGFGGPGGPGGPGGGFDPSSFISRMDRNGNGNIDPEEMEGPARFMLERMARGNPKIDMSKPIPISAITDAMSAFRRDRESSWGGSSWGGSSWGGSSSEESSSSEVKVLVPGFGIKKELTPVPGFGSNPNQVAVKTEEQDLREADERISRYDRNRDGILDAEEIKEGRWSDDPMVFDQNADGKLTRDELAVRYAKRRMGSSSSTSSSGASSSSRDSRDRGGMTVDRRDSDKKEKEKEFVNPFEKISSYRTTDRDGNPKRPTGLPEWFTRKDIDFDNQVSMREFASKWTSDVVEDFDRFDTNLDGFITAKECQIAVKKGYIPGASSSSSPSQSSSTDDKTAGPSSASGSSATTERMGSPSSGSKSPSSANSAIDDRMKEWVAKKIKPMDKDGNGKLDPAELKVYAADYDFATVDLNKDGLVDVDEIVIHRGKKK
jgi:Ca2+-binding EF-hand superfamily protein